MFKWLRIISSLLAAAACAAAVFIFVYFLWWGFVCVGAAFAFFGLTLLFKYLQEKRETELNPPPLKGDFITGRIPKDEDK